MRPIILMTIVALAMAVGAAAQSFAHARQGDTIVDRVIAALAAEAGAKPSGGSGGPKGPGTHSVTR